MKPLNCEQLTTDLFRLAGCDVERTTWYEAHSKHKYDLLGFDRLAIAPLVLDHRFPWMDRNTMWIQVTSRSNISTRQKSVAGRYELLFRMLPDRFFCIGWDRWQKRGERRFRLLEFDTVRRTWTLLSQRVVTLKQLRGDADV